MSLTIPVLKVFIQVLLTAIMVVTYMLLQEYDVDDSLVNALYLLTLCMGYVVTTINIWGVFL